MARGIKVSQDEGHGLKSKPRLKRLVVVLGEMGDGVRSHGNLD